MHGAAEKDGEDARSVVVNIIEKITPVIGAGLQECVDVAHCLGQKHSDGKARSIIILFSLRRIRGLVWAAAKGCKILTIEQRGTSYGLS